MKEVFAKIKKEAVNQYKNKKEEEGVSVFEDLDKAINSKMYKNFKIVQNVIWSHDFYSKNKTMFVFDFFRAIEDLIEKYRINLEWNRFDIVFDIHGWNFKDIDVPKNMADQNLWNMYIRDSNKKIWRTINNQLFMEYISRT